jgi:alkylation response protein AidB-like acyl-CoA dehydrogenase
MHQRLMTPELNAFRQAFRSFALRELTPHYAQWERDGVVSRQAWESAGAAGFLCIPQAEVWGGAGLDFRFAAVVQEELASLQLGGVFFPLHSDIVAPYIERYGTDPQKQSWLPQMALGKAIGAIAMTEPGTGSDLQRIQCRAVLEGDEWVINGSKTFISNGSCCDLCVVAVRTDDDAGWSSLSLIVVEATRPGFVRGKKLEKIGLRAQDTTELHFENCRVPKTNLLGERGQGFVYLMQQLAQERLVLAVGCVAGARSMLDMTTTYVQQRHAFGKPLSALQNTRFKLAEMATEISLGEALVDRCIEQMNAGDDVTVDAAKAKWWTSEMVGRVADECLQLHGGYGYMQEMPIARAYLDARVQRIYAGTTEIMKEIIARSLV